MALRSADLGPGDEAVASCRCGITALNYVGVHKSAQATRVIVVSVLVVLGVVVVAVVGRTHPSVLSERRRTGTTILGVPGAGFLFFAFAG